MRLARLLGPLGFALVVVPSIFSCSLDHTLWDFVSDNPDPLFRFIQDSKAGFINSRGTVVIKPVLHVGETSLRDFTEGLLGLTNTKESRFVDRSGNEMFRVAAWVSGGFSEGLAAAEKDGKWGFIDRNGAFVIPPRYSHVSEFSEGLAKVSESGETGAIGFIDKSGNVVIPLKLTYALNFHGGVAAAVPDGPCRLTNGGSCDAAQFFPRWPLIVDCRYTYIDKSGKPITKLRFDAAMDFNSEGLAPVRIGSKWGYIDRTGALTIHPAFDAAGPFSEGVAVVHQGDLAGFINRRGQFVIQPKFSSARGFSNGCAGDRDRTGTGRLPVHRQVRQSGILRLVHECKVVPVWTCTRGARLLHLCLDRS